MGKLHFSNDLQKRRTSRSLLAVSLAASLAAFGCTTNLNPGNGTPTRSGPEIRTAPTSGISTGSEVVTPPPMTSSYTRAEVLPRVTPRSNRVIKRSAAEAAAIMAGRQTLRGRYLGPANPGPGNRPYASDYQQGFVNPALLTNPQLTINSSISSPGTNALNNGTAGIATDAGVLASTVNTAGTTAAATVAGTTTGGAVAATTGTGVGLPAGTFATVRPAVTESISNNPAVTAASLGAGRAGIPGTGTVGTTTAAATTVTPTAAVGATQTVTAASASGAVRVVRGTGGAVTITNANATTGTGSSARSQ